MAVLNAGDRQTMSLPAGEALTVVATAAGSASATRLGDRPGETAQGVVLISASQTKIIGPFSTPSRHDVSCTAGAITVTQAAVNPDTDAATFATAAQVAAIAASVPRAALTSAVIAGGAAGDHTLSAIVVGDALVSVIRCIGAGVAVTDITDITGEFTVGAGKINNAAGTDTTGDKLLVLYNDLTA